MSVAPPSIKRTVAVAQEKPVAVPNSDIQNEDVESTTQLDTLLAAFDAQIENLKELKKQTKAAIKAARKRRTPEQIAADAAKPKREQSEASKAWTDYVNRVYEEMKLADPAVLRPAAMQEAKRRRDAGDADAPAKADDSASKASKEVEKEARKAAKEEEKAAKEEAKAAEKAAKEEAKAAAQAAKEEAKATKLASQAAAAAAKEEAKAAVAAAKLAAQQAKEQAKALAAAAKGTKAKPASAAAAPVEEEEEESLTPFLHKGKYYFRSSKNECWAAAGPANDQLGAWAGIYNPATNAIKPGPEPKLA